MNIAMSTLNDISTNYIMRLNEKEVLVSQEDPLLASQAKEKEAKHEKEQEDKHEKEQEDKKAKISQERSQPNKLSEDEERLVKELAARDAEVKGHEAAHQAAGGGMTGLATFTYQQGPDGKMYAIGGEVSISTPTTSSPEEAIKIARQVAAAAMAAGEPSSQDFSVAASARVMEMKAQQQLAKEKQEKIAGLQNYKETQNNPNISEEKTPLLDIPA